MIGAVASIRNDDNLKNEIISHALEFFEWCPATVNSQQSEQVIKRATNVLASASNTKDVNLQIAIVKLCAGIYGRIGKQNQMVWKHPGDMLTQRRNEFENTLQEVVGKNYPQWKKQEKKLGKSSATAAVATGAAVNLPDFIALIEKPILSPGSELEVAYSNYPPRAYPNKSSHGSWKRFFGLRERNTRLGWDHASPEIKAQAVHDFFQSPAASCRPFSGSKT